MFDRIKQNAGSAVEVPNLLSHVMTHGINHLLQGISRHSQTGVIRAYEDTHDFLQMAENPLPLAPEDLDLIQRGLRQRAGGAGSAVSPPTTMALR